jgi:hypothetical protein
MRATFNGWGSLVGIGRSALGTLWRETDPFVAIAFVFCCGCGASSQSDPKPENDAGAGGASFDAGAGGTSSDAGSGRTSFDENDAAPCGDGTVWEQILEPAEAAARGRLSALLGPERGLVIYRGTAAAHDNRGLVSSSGEGELSGDVLARLDPASRVFGEPAPVLTIKSLTGDEYFTVYQPVEAATTFVSPLLPWAMTWTNVLEDNGEVDAAVAVPRLADAPSPLSFELSATGADVESGTELEVEASATLERVEPIPFSDLLALTPDGDLTLDGFTPSADGREFARVVIAVASVSSACVPEDSGFAPGECGYLATYSVEQYAEAEAIDKNGLRSFEIQSVFMNCYHCTRVDGVSDARRCVEGERQRRYP